MLTQNHRKPAKIEARNRRRERKLWEQPDLTPSLGCFTCPQFKTCGGLHTQLGLFDCMGHCCHQPSACTKMCRLKALDFTQRFREVGGFEFDNVPRAPILVAAHLPEIVPMIYHGNRRDRFYEGPAIALSLHRLLHRATGQPKFATEDELRAEFRIAPTTTIILSGTDLDLPLERWWSYGSAVRASAIASLRRLGIGLVTTPNYSLFANYPRWDDLHSMKRIALANDEFLQAGLPAALHVNARSDRDNERWIAFVADRPEITHLAYEFTTGAGRSERREVHARWLAKLARSVDRPLTLVMRGRLEVLPILTEAFDKVVVLETSAFIKAMKRRRALARGNAGVGWEAVPTAVGSALDDIFEHNVRFMNETVRLLAAGSSNSQKASAA